MIKFLDYTNILLYLFPLLVLVLGAAECIIICSSSWDLNSQKAKHFLIYVLCFILRVSYW